MNVALWAEIRRLAEIEKLSGRVIARRLHCARHTVAPITETFPMSKVNDALEHLRSGKARYRIGKRQRSGSGENCEYERRGRDHNAATPALGADRCSILGQGHDIPHG